MTGPREIIRQAAKQRSSQAEITDQRTPTPVPIAPVRTMRSPEHRPVQEKQATSPVTNWRMPPLVPEQTGAFVHQETAGCDVQERTGQSAFNADTPQEENYRLVPRNIGGHAIYRDLMRSHDRMGTRHIPPRG